MFIGKWNRSVILTYIGVLFGLMGMYMSISNNFKYSIIFMIISGICDLFDGTVARKCKRTDEEKEFGIQIDSLADMINFGVAPVILFICYGYDNFCDVIIYGIYMICQLARLAYFNIITTKESKVKYYQGLPVTYSALIFPLIYLLSFIIPKDVFHLIVFLTILIISVLNIANIKIKKPRGKAYIFFSLLAIVVIVGLLMS